jgi:hypothetical protein
MTHLAYPIGLVSPTSVTYIEYGAENRYMQVGVIATLEAEVMAPFD